MRRTFTTLAAVLATFAVAAPASAQYELPPAPEAPELRVSVIRPSGTSLTQGKRYTWRIRVRNVGRVPARAIVVTARWEAGLVSVRGGRVDRRKRRSTFTLRTLGTRRSKTFLLSGVVGRTARLVSVRASATFKG